MPKNYLLCLRVWHHSGLVHLEEHTGDINMCERLAKSGLLRPGAYQTRCTAYNYGSGDVVNACSFGTISQGWRF